MPSFILPLWAAAVTSVLTRRTEKVPQSSIMNVVFWRRVCRPNPPLLLVVMVLLVLTTSLWPALPLGQVQSFDHRRVPRLSTETNPNGPGRVWGEGVSGVLRARWVHYRAACEGRRHSGGVPGLVQNPLVYLPANLTVCWVPKVGCTFWKRIFFYLHNDGHGPWTSKPVRSPFDIDRIFVHLHGGKKKTLRFDDESEHDVIFHTRRVMFSRDPWSRLWSDYVDKFILPDSWLDHGKTILRLRQRLSARSDVTGTDTPLGGSRFHTGNDTKVCADDVTFPEFLHYALLVNHDAHWSPVHLTCNPCVFRPHLLGKLETFSRDALYVLRASGLGHLMPDISHSAHVKDEIQLLVDYHFRLWELRSELQACLGLVSLARRLWRSFQLSGYLPQGCVFPEETLKGELLHVPVFVARDAFTEHVISVSSDRRVSHSEWLRLRRRNMVEMYRTVPRHLLELVQDRFFWDFHLFQYDPSPQDLFGNMGEK
ncbi:hypothetical protein ACOMHN_046641 [Nucella lapillus]